jgi:cytochrome b involved in lipid metabolism
MAIAAIFVNGFIFNRNDVAIFPDTTKDVAIKNAVNIPGETFFPLAEISKHNSVNDCWLLIGGKVYNVTDYIYQHPGNADTIIAYCGKEASAAFADKGSGKKHSEKAVSLLNKYILGAIDNTINADGLSK